MYYISVTLCNNNNNILCIKYCRNICKIYLSTDNLVNKLTIK